MPSVDDASDADPDAVVEVARLVEPRVLRRLLKRFAAVAEVAEVAAGAEVVDAVATVEAVVDDESSPKSEPSFPSKEDQLNEDDESESDVDDVLELPKFSRSQSAILSTTLSARDVPELEAAAAGAVVAATATAEVGVEAPTAVAGAAGL